MGIMIKVASLSDPIVIDGDSVAYAENGTVLEILDPKGELIAAFQNWQYAILEDGEEDDEDLDDDLDDEDLEEEDLDDEELEDLDGEELEDLEEVATVDPSVDEEEAVQRAREVMAKAIADHQLTTPPLTLEQFDQNAAKSLEDGAPTN